MQGQVSRGSTGYYSPRPPAVDGEAQYMDQRQPVGQQQGLQEGGDGAGLLIFTLDPDVVHPKREITYRLGQGVGVPDIEALAPARSGTGEQLLGAEER